MKKRILIVEDEIELATQYQKIILNIGFDCEVATTEYEAINLLEEYKPNLAILDIELKNNKEGGIKIAKYITEHYKIPFIYLTGSRVNKEMLNKIYSTKHNGYFAKPFERIHFEVNIKSILGLGVDILELVDGYILDTNLKAIVSNGNLIGKLSSKSYELLKILATRKNQVVPFNTINDLIYKDKIGNHSALRELVRELRNNYNFLNIETERGIGYRLSIDWK